MSVRECLSRVSALALCSAGCGLLGFVPAAEAAGPPVPGEESVVDVASSSATLLAQVNPEGVDTTYRFEYGTTAAYGSSLPMPNGEAGAGTSTIEVQAHPQDLLAGTVYHYRVVAENSGGKGEGKDQTFTTQASVTEPTLPDGRAWEMVSPPQKMGAQVIPLNPSVTQASEDGDAISYVMSAPFVANPDGNALLTQALSRRGPGGWSSEDIATPHSGITSVTNNRYGEYEFFSTDLSSALVTPFGETPLSPEVTEPTPYIRDNTSGEYTPLLTKADVAAGAQFGDQNEGEETVAFVTATPDLKHVVLQASETRPLVEKSPPKQRNFYEWSSGRLQLIDTASALIELGSEFNDKGAISDNGSRVFWRVTNNPESHLYMTDMLDGQVTRLDAAQGVSEPSSNNSVFQFANGEGSMVFFTDVSQLTTSPGGGLYVYDVETGKLTLITTTVGGAEEPNVRGVVLGGGETGDEIYFVARGVLTESPNGEEDKAVAGADNLYALRRQVSGSSENWTPSFVARLSGDDETEWNLEREVDHRTVEVSANGRYLAFMSDRSLTGYDNRDANSGEPDEEVYLYDANQARLACASCDPSGARPSGWQEEPLVLSDLGAGAWTGRWVAATIPGMTRFMAGFRDFAVHEPAYLSNSGRLFFDSRDALVASDINGVGDVYEYEPERVGSCTAAKGCVALISGGFGAKESAFADASSSGDDVFFLTADPLSSQDVGTEYDMYDAHVCSTQAPCAPSVASPPPCETADGCKGALTPQPGVFGAPASALLIGSGNPTALPVSAAKVRPKTLTGAQRRAAALRACRSKPKRERAACRARARRRYAVGSLAKGTRKVKAGRGGSR